LKIVDQDPGSIGSALAYAGLLERIEILRSAPRWATTLERPEIDLRRLCDEDRFREDPFYRLGVINVTLPLLRERKDEIPLLFEFFDDEAAEALKRRPIEMTRRLRRFLLDYAYPGNIRELRNIIYRLTCLAAPTADLEHMPANIRTAPPARGERSSSDADGGEPTTATATALGDAKRVASDEAERGFLERGLQEVGGLVTELARRCDMNRSHVQMLLKKHGLKSKDFRATARGAG
jgi:DNA-binding NtrC family response regulator